MHEAAAALLSKVMVGDRLAVLLSAGDRVMCGEAVLGCAFK